MSQFQWQSRKIQPGTGGTFGRPGNLSQNVVALNELKFTLHGRKLTGSWVLVRTRSAAPGGRAAWLLIKHRDAAVSTDDVTATEPRSVVSRRLLAEIAWHEGGNVEKAASGDPPGEIQKLIAEPRLVRQRRRGTRAVWHSSRPAQ